MKTCRICKERFEPVRPMQPTCQAFSCQVAYADKAADKSRKNRQAVERKEIKARRESIKTRSDYLKEAQKAWNYYVRMRDYGKPCASCGAMPDQKFGGTMDCSHYRSIGAAPHLRFHLHNAAAACVKCNRHLGGNVAALRVGMISRIGIEKVEAVESNNDVRKFDIEYLKRVKKIFSKKAARARTTKGKTWN
ncbi:MAG: recombination protein NinG [Acidobacteria bacterium]|nr:recombination protein NinG [Acidobacteriota bacterium]